MSTAPGQEALLSPPQARGVLLNRASRYAHIDALRGAAVLVVLAQHTGISKAPGDSGVTAFFTISGFIITLVLLKELRRSGSFDLWTFYRRRLLKIGPPFLVAVVVPTAVWAVSHPVSWTAVLSQVFFTYNWVQVFDNGASAMVLPGTSVVWSLAVEEQFYIAFALLWLLLVRRSWWRRGLVVASCAAVLYATALRIVLCVRGDAVEHVLRGTDVRMDAIAWGVLAAVAFEAHSSGRPVAAVPRLSAAWVPWVAVAAAAAASIIGDDQYEAVWRGLVFGPATAAIIIFGLQPREGATHQLLRRVSGWRWLQAVGLASYSIYISHYVAIEAVASSVSDLPTPVALGVLAAVGLVTGFCVYAAVERPVMRLRARQGW